MSARLVATLSSLNDQPCLIFMSSVELFPMLQIGFSASNALKLFGHRLKKTASQTFKRSSIQLKWNEIGKNQPTHADNNIVRLVFCAHSIHFNLSYKNRHMGLQLQFTINVNFCTTNISIRIHNFSPKHPSSTWVVLQGNERKAASSFRGSTLKWYLVLFPRNIYFVHFVVSRLVEKCYACRCNSMALVRL